MDKSLFTLSSFFKTIYKVTPLYAGIKAEGALKTHCFQRIENRCE